MPHDYEDLHNADQLDDDELRRLVREQLAQSSGLDVTKISVNASSGSVILSGRVGTDEERQIAEHVLTDVLGLDKYRNDLVVDFNYRGEAPEASDDLSEDRESADDASELDIEVPLSGESPFLADTVIEPPGDAFDAESAVEDGTTWSPPSRPNARGTARHGMTPAHEILWLFVLPLPIACIAWTVTHEDLFKELHDWCVAKSKSASRLVTRKFFYLFTCEYCFSHYVTAAVLLITRYTLLFDGWRGYLVSGFSLVWVANLYMGLFAWLRLEIREDRIEIAVAEREADLPPGSDRRTHRFGAARGKAPRDGTM